MMMMNSTVAVRCLGFLPPSTIDAWLAVDAPSRGIIASWMVHSEFVALGNRVPDVSKLPTSFVALVVPALANDGTESHGCEEGTVPWVSGASGVELPPWTLDHLAVRFMEWREYCTMIDTARWEQLLERGFGSDWKATLWSRRHGPMARWIAECIANRRADAALHVSLWGDAIVAAVGDNPWLEPGIDVPDFILSHDYNELVVHRCASLREAGEFFVSRTQGLHILEACTACSAHRVSHVLPEDNVFVDDLLLSFDGRAQRNQYFLEYCEVDGRNTIVKSANPRHMAQKQEVSTGKQPRYSIEVLRMRDWEFNCADDPLCGHVMRILAERCHFNKLDLRMSRGCGDLSMFKGVPNIAHVRTPYMTKELSDESICLFPDLVSVNLTYSAEIEELRGFRQNNKLRTVRFPYSVKRIMTHAFGECLSLRRVDLSACLQLESIDGFGMCVSLVQVVLPSSLTEIGENGFVCCGALGQVDLSHCHRLTRIDGFMDCTRLEGLQLPPSLQYIGASAFRRCIALRGVDFSKCSPALQVHGFAECESLQSVTSVAPSVVWSASPMMVRPLRGGANNTVKSAVVVSAPSPPTVAPDGRQ